MNNNDEVVGKLTTSLEVDSAMYATEDAVWDLNTLIPEETREVLHLNQALAINDKGEILCEGK